MCWWGVYTPTWGESAPHPDVGGVCTPHTRTPHLLIAEPEATAAARTGRVCAMCARRGIAFEANQRPAATESAAKVPAAPAETLSDEAGADGEA